MKGSFRADVYADIGRFSAKRRVFTVLVGLFIYPGFLASLLYRLSHRARRYGAFGKLMSKFFWRLNVFVSSCDISPYAVIGPGLYIPHPAGIVIGAARIGAMVTILQNATIGKKYVSLANDFENFATLGDEVLVSSGAVILGPVEIGSGATVGANAVVLTSVPPAHVAVGVPARIFPGGKASSGGDHVDGSERLVS